MITALKGSPQYAIDNSGIMTITTTWMVIPDDTSSGNSATSWLAFEADVESWAGKPGDKYKKPKLGDNSREATAYDDSDAFIVSDINYMCVSGRTHYEVTFTNVQNLAVMQMIGNVSAEINENNEKTKSVNYQLDVAPDDPLAIDANFIESGTTVDWAGTSFLVSSSSYNAVSKTRYELSITATDMSVMMIGNPQKSTDAFGQQTMSAKWRYSATAYEDWVQPDAGSDASSYLGLSNGSGYLVTDVSVEPNGVLGYDITINAKHISKRVVKVSRQETKKSSGVGYYTKHTIQYQSDADSLSDFNGIVGASASDYLDDAVGSVTEVSVDEAGRNDYDVQITTTDEPQSSGGRSSSSSDDLGDQVEVSMSQGHFVLDPKQAGWFQGLSGEYYKINFPPTTKFRYTVTPESLKDMSKANATTPLTDEKILNAIKSLQPIGFDRIVGVQAEVGGTVKWVKKSELAGITSLSSVSSLKLEGFVYAQADMTVQGESIRNLLFEPFEHAKHCPIVVNGLTQYKNRDVAFNRIYLTYKIQVMDINVTMNYKGKAKKILSNDFNEYYKKAINYVRNQSFSSYKGAGINLSETRDENDTVWTQVTCTISAILDSNGNGMKWNSDYDDSYVE